MDQNQLVIMLFDLTQCWPTGGYLCFYFNLSKLSTFKNMKILLTDSNRLIILESETLC